MTGLHFGDADPEDGWDASDPVPVLLDNIAVRIRDLFDGPPRPDRTGRVTRLLLHIAVIRDRAEAGEL